MNKTKLKMDLIDQGFDVKNTTHMPSGLRLLSVSLPPAYMREFKKNALIYGTKRALIRNLLHHYMNNAKPGTVKPSVVIYTKELILNLKALDMEFTTTKHADFQFNSFTISQNDYDLIQNIQWKYGITRSAVVRVLLDLL